MFDGGIFFGREPKYGIELTPDELINRAVARGVNIALATHWEAIYFDMYAGNAFMLDISKKYLGKVLPLAVVNPQHYDCTTGYLNKIKQDGFSGVACFPYYQGWKLNRYAFKKLANDVSAVGLPLQIAIGSVDELSDLVESVRQLTTPVLVRWVRGGGYVAVPDIIAIAKDIPHIYFDIGNLVTLGGVAHLVKTIGADRLYLATNSPLVYEACPELLVETAKISTDDKDKIEFGTLATIFKSSVISSRSDKFGLTTKISHPLRQVRDDNIKQHLSRQKIDIHWHGEGWDIIETRTGVEPLIDVMNDFQYEAVITSSILALNYDLVRGNVQTAEWTKHDNRIHGYIVYDPTRIDVSLSELEKYKNNPAFVGIKTIQDYYNVGLDDLRYRPMLDWAKDNDWPILCHRAGVAKVAKEFPSVTFVTAHMTKERMPDFVSLRNVVIDISGSYAHSGETDLRAMLDAFGSERILFAADGPLMTPAWSIGKIISSGFEESALEKIYRQNAKRIFKRLKI